MVEWHEWTLDKDLPELGLHKGQVVGCFEDTDMSCCDGVWGGVGITPLGRMWMGMPPYPWQAGAGAMGWTAPRRKEEPTGNG